MLRTNIRTILESFIAKMKFIVSDAGQVLSMFKSLLNIIESTVSDNEKLTQQNQVLKDENNRLKGEQGKPNIRKQSQKKKNISSESERKERKENSEKELKKKKRKITPDSTEICKIDKTELPADAKFKDYQYVVVQDIKIETNNIQFKKERYYSPSLKKTFTAQLPLGYDGKFGPNIKALVIDLHHSKKMTESAIDDFMDTHGIVISKATISRMLTDNHDDFHQEKKDVVQAGLASSVYQQMDDTSARVNGKNHYTHILCNPWYTAYFTRAYKNRLTIIDILTQGKMTFQFNELSYALMAQLKLPEKYLISLKSSIEKEAMNRADLDAILNTLFPNPKKHLSHKQVVLDASAIVAYQQLPNAIKLLLTDDAPQFKKITESLALCWVHDGRHYKKLTPIVSLHRIKLEKFLSKYWDYYRKLREYKKSPKPLCAQLLSQEFDTLFATTTGYTQLDDRIEKTKLKKESLLLVLTHPSLPLHNNTSELGARRQARYRDISLHTINKKGTEAKDTFMTLVATSKKLSVNSYHYLHDRISKEYKMPSLASLIKKHTDGFAYNSS